MHLLCRTDDSIAGGAAVRVTAELAGSLHAELAELAAAGAGASDPAPALARAARAAGCDLVVVGVAPGSLLAGGSPPGWQHRVVRDAPSPVILVPVGCAPARGGGVLLADDVDALPHQAARAAGRLAQRLRAPLVVTHVLSSRVAASRPSGSVWPLHHRSPVPAGAAPCAGDGAPVVRRPGPDEGPAPFGPIAAAREATLVVIAGRGAGRTLLPHRRRARRLGADRRPPIIVAAPPGRV